MTESKKNRIEKTVTKGKQRYFVNLYNGHELVIKCDGIIRDGVGICFSMEHSETGDIFIPWQQILFVSGLDNKNQMPILEKWSEGDYG